MLEAEAAANLSNLISNCLTVNGTRYLNKLKAGLVDTCSIMDHWKLILVQYVVTTQESQLDCLYNCQDQQTTDDPYSIQPTCAELLATGGPTTGLHTLWV